MKPTISKGRAAEVEAEMEAAKKRQAELLNHPRAKAFTCESCGTFFATAEDIQEDTDKHGKPVKYISCPYCTCDIDLA